ncbi:MAG: prepilin-type N-terminal cleavage/methylation domain-containing protein [Candidatus Kaelpia imicola]|nr:prepilin-type N-terminal cleavage/methylation domain-containing protein [Candidatus Kaelpia imicola]
MKRGKGFTMLEVLIVIIIIAILATFAIPQYLKASKRAIASEAVTTLGALRGGLARYYQEYNTLTSDLDELDVDNPDDVPNANFSYTIDTGSDDLSDYELTADGESGTRADGITVTYTADDNKIDIDYP